MTFHLVVWTCDFTSSSGFVNHGQHAKLVHVVDRTVELLAARRWRLSERYVLLENCKSRIFRMHFFSYILLFRTRRLLYENFVRRSTNAIGQFHSHRTNSKMHTKGQRSPAYDGLVRIDLPNVLTKVSTHSSGLHSHLHGMKQHLFSYNLSVGILLNVGGQTGKDCLLTWADGVKSR